MQRNNSDDQAITSDKDDNGAANAANNIVVNYHKHDTVGGMGHVSMRSSYNGETVDLSVYPSTSSYSTYLSYLTGLAVPVPAENREIGKNHEGCSPIVATYDITDDVPDHKGAHEKLKQIRGDIESRKTAFSTIQNTFTTVFHALTSSRVNTINILTGFKTLDRETIDNELENADVTNCAHSANQVLSAGGHRTSGGILSYPTPSEVNGLFAGRKPNRHIAVAGLTAPTGPSVDESMENAIKRGFND